MLQWRTRAPELQNMQELLQGMIYHSSCCVSGSGCDSPGLITLPDDPAVAEIRSTLGICRKTCWQHRHVALQAWQAQSQLRPSHALLSMRRNL